MEAAADDGEMTVEQALAHLKSSLGLDDAMRKPHDVLEAARSQLDTQSAALAQERPSPAARSQDESAAAEEAGAGAQQVEMALELTQLRERLEEEQRARAAAERAAAQAAQQQTSATPPRTPLKHRLAAEMEVRPPLPACTTLTLCACRLTVACSPGTGGSELPAKSAQSRGASVWRI